MAARAVSGRNLLNLSKYSGNFPPAPLRTARIARVVFQDRLIDFARTSKVAGIVDQGPLDVELPAFRNLQSRCSVNSSF